MDEAEIDEIRKKTIKQLLELADIDVIDDVDNTRKHAVGLLTDFLEILGENEMVEAFEDIPLIHV
jgi:hypothetical protein